MRNYTTLGTGRATKLLATTPWSPARTVTTASNAAAVTAARALERTDRQLPATLYGLAVERNGEPVEARRALLSHFDANLDSDTVGNGGHWERAETLVANVARAVRGEPAAVHTAIRNELAGHLDGFDGVLVPARAIGHCPKAVKLNLVVSGPYTWLGDSLWGYVLGEHSDLTVGVDDDVYPLGEPVADSIELSYPILAELAHAEPSDTDYNSEDVEYMMTHSSDDDPPRLLTSAAAVLAWIRHHRPDDLGAAERLLSAT